MRPIFNQKGEKKNENENDPRPNTCVELIVLLAVLAEQCDDRARLGELSSSRDTLSRRVDLYMEVI